LCENKFFNFQSRGFACVGEASESVVDLAAPSIFPKGWLFFLASTIIGCHPIQHPELHPPKQFKAGRTETDVY
jgi:hypothetical protein